VALGAVVLVFLLSFFPWLRVLTPLVGALNLANAWQAAFDSPVNVLMIFYVLLLILLLLLSIPAALASVFVGSLPPGVRDLLKWRYVVVGGLTLVSFLCLLLQLLVGFTEENQLGGGFIIRTSFLTLAVLLHFVALVACLLALWTDLRGNRPIPRVDVVW
jgi:hypothetical protein